MSHLFSGFDLSYFNDLGFLAIAAVAFSENRQGWYIFFSQVLNLLDLSYHDFGMPVLQSECKSITGYITSVILSALRPLMAWIWPLDL